MRWLQAAEGRTFLVEAYVKQERSTHDIARELGTYANRIRRALLVHGIRLRDHSAAQLAALERGRSRHPTQGQSHSQTHREALRDAALARVRVLGKLNAPTSKGEADERGA